MELFSPQLDQLGLYPELRETVEIYAVLLPLIRTAEVPIPPCSLAAEELCARLAEGVPLVRSLAILATKESAPRLMLAFARALRDNAGESYENRQEAARICLALEEHTLNPDILLGHAAEGDRGFVMALARNLGLDGQLVSIITESARKPSLRALEQQLAPRIVACEWTRTECPICGAFVLFAEHRGGDTRRHLRCGVCGADWSGKAWCLHCGETDSRILGEPTHNRGGPPTHVQACDHCQGYFKVIVTDQRSDPDFLMLHDLATFPLDRMAQSQGYTRLPIQA